MSEKIRNRRTVIAAGVLSLALVAPATNVPVIQDLALPVAYAATQPSTFDQRYATENFWQKGEAKITGLTLDAGDKVESTASTIFNWKFRNDKGELFLIRPQSGAAFKSGNVDINVNVTPAGGAPFTATLKVKVIDEEDTTWQDALPDFATRRAVDFSNDLVQDISALNVPPEVEIGKDGITPLGWNVANNNGVLQVQAPGTFAGTAPVNVDIPIKLTYNGSEKKATLLLKATPPKKSAAGGTAGTVGGALLPILGGVIGLIPGAAPLGNALGSLGNLLGGLGGGNNGGTGGTGGNTGGTGGTGGNTGGRGGIFDGMFRDAVKIEVKDNGSHNGSNNTGIAPSAVAPSAVVVSDNASNNGSNNTGVAPSAVNVSDNGSNNTGVAPSAVNVSDNGSNNTGVAPSAVNVSDNGSNNTGIAPSAVNVSDIASNNTGVAPSAVNVSDNGSNNTGVAPSAVAPSAVNVSDIASHNTGVAPSAVNVSGNGSNNTGMAPSAVNVSDNGSNNTGIAPSAVAPSAVIVTDNGSNNASNNTGIDKRRGEGKAPAADGKSKISDPKCIASLVGFGLPAAVLIPVLLANVFRIPGFEGIQDSMKAAAASIGAPLNIPKEQVAAGVGGFAGAFAIAGLIGTITQCVPSKAEKEAAESSEPSTTETAAPTTTESTTPAPKPSGSSKKAPKTTEPTPATK